LRFTLVTTAKEIALLDAIQYLAEGPCVEAVTGDQVLAYEQADLLGEQQWQLFAQATAAASVASTLSLPTLNETGRVVGSVNLYASMSPAFDGQHEAIAHIVDAWAPGAVTNADLSFATRSVAERAPDLLREDLDLTVASTVIAAQNDVSIDALHGKDSARLLDAPESPRHSWRRPSSTSTASKTANDQRPTAA
jgi:GAF domain-containing protein